MIAGNDILPRFSSSLQYTGMTGAVDAQNHRNISRSLRADSEATMTLSPTPQALFFDVFGTCVDWRTTVVGALQIQAHASLNSATASLASSVRLRASEMTSVHWETFAQQWRRGYQKFTRGLAEDPSLPWVSVDEHHLSSLKTLMVDWKIEGLWTDEELRTLALIWHHLIPWDDAAAGVALLNKSFGG